MPLYPPALIYLLLPLEWSLSFFCLLHLFVAGLGMYCLARRWTGNRGAAAVAGVIFAFNGLSLNLLMWPSHIATLSWMPWVVLTVERAWEEGGRRIVVAALVGALQMLAGGPETILLTWLLLLGLWGVGCLPRRDQAPRLRSALRFAWVVLFVAGLAAAQLLPFLDLAAHSQRSPGYADARWSMPCWGWANFLVPMAFGSVWNQGLFFQHGQAWTSSYYMGIGALLLAVLAVVTVRDRRVWLLGVAAGMALLLSFGDSVFLYRWARHFLPQLSLVTYPVKFVLLISFCVPLLAGFALARLQASSGHDASGYGRRLAILGAGLLALIAGILLWAWRFPMPGDNFAATLRNGLGRAALLAAAVILLAALLRRGRPRAQRLVLLLLVAVLWLDVWTHEPPQNPTVAPWVYAPGLARAKLRMQPQPALGESRAMIRPAADSRFMQIIARDPKDNFLAKRLGCFADCNLLDDVPKVNGFFSLYPRECGELASVLYVSTNTYLECLADFMAVSQITAPGQFVEWAPRTTFLPMATAGQQPVYLDDTNALLRLIRPGFDARTWVILPPESRAWVTATNRTAARLIPRRFAASHWELELEAAQPALVVFSQTYYHAWRAYVDGQPARLLRANYAFQAVETPAGRHRVRLVYEDRAFYVGAALSGLALAACAVVWTLARTPRRRQAGA